MNRAKPAMNKRLRPSRSASRPPSRSTPPKKIEYAVITHCRLVSEKWRSVLIDGSATFTIATSRTTMNCAATTTASPSQRLLSTVSSCLAAGCVTISELIDLSFRSLTLATIARTHAWVLH